MKTTVLPDRFLTKMSATDRAKLGTAGMTAAEGQQIAIAKTERELQNQITAMLRRNGIWPIVQRMDRRSNIAIGSPDIVFAVKGRPVAWECKLPGKKPTAEQEDAMRIMSANGFLCDVIHHYDEALGIFNELTK